MEFNSTEAQNLSDIYARRPLATLVPEWCRIVLLVYMWIVFIIGTPGNALVIFTQIKTKKKTSTDWFVTFLALSDLLTLVVSVPVYSLVILNWWATFGSTFGCRLHFGIIHLTLIAQTTIMAEIAVDRVWKSKSVYQIFTPERAFYCSIATYVGSFVLATGVALTRHANYRGECVRDDSMKHLHIITYAISAVVVVVSIFTIVVSYIFVFKFLKARNKNRPGVTTTNTADKDKGPPIPSLISRSQRTTKILFIVTIVYGIFLVIPSICGILLAISEFRNIMHWSIVLFFITRLYLINSAANPIIFICVNSTFRNRMSALFK